MSTTTTNLGLVKPELTDAADITAMNPNWDEIDSELIDKWSKTAETITENANLDDYKNLGIYVYSYGAASTISNVPEVAQGTLFVLPRLLSSNSANKIQIIVTQNSNVYIRNLMDGTWQDWYKLYNSNDVIPIEDGGTGATYPEEARKNLKVNVQTYRSLADIGLTPGSETIETIANAIPGDSELICSITADNADIYPNGKLGLLRVTKRDIGRIRFEWTQKENGVVYVGMYSSSNETPWTGWHKMMDEKPPFIEFNPTSTSTGGYIDFHYDGSSEDYTSRIIEDALGHLRIIAANGILVPSIDPSVKSLRNIYAGTTDLTAGTSTLETGTLYLVYE